MQEPINKSVLINRSVESDNDLEAELKKSKALKESVISNFSHDKFSIMN